MIDGERWPLVDAARMQALDRHTIEELGIPGEILMESAGRAVLEVLLQRHGERLLSSGGEVCVVCGAGNNAGDGFVVARHLALLGWPVRIVLASPAAGLRGDAARHFALAQAVGVTVEDGDWEPPRRGVLVDAIFGTGLSREIEGPMRVAIERINQTAGPEVAVVAVDLPSGLDAGTGQVWGAAVQADQTVTISLPKLGLALEPGRSLAGEVEVARIGIADQLPGEIRAEGLEAAQLLTPRAMASLLPARPQIGHKGSFGHVLVVAASAGKTGAAALAARAAGRVGAGLVTLACPASLGDILEVKCTEAMTAPVPETPDRSLAEAGLDEILQLAVERDVTALGPGIGQDPDTVSLVRGLAARVPTPMVIDADGLNAFAHKAGALQARPGATVLTPHPGEAARLLGTGASEINRDRVGAARELAEITGAVVLLKGAASVSAAPDGRVIVNPTGGPALASGGTGDVLTGMVAGLLAQGLGALEAAAAAAYLHGEAADRLAAAGGSAGLLAEDLANAIPAAAEALRRRGGADGSGGGPGARGTSTLLSFPGT